MPASPVACDHYLLTSPGQPSSPAFLTQPTPAKLQCNPSVSWPVVWREGGRRRRRTMPEEKSPWKKETDHSPMSKTKPYLRHSPSPFPPLTILGRGKWCGRWRRYVGRRPPSGGSLLCGRRKGGEALPVLGLSCILVVLTWQWWGRLNDSNPQWCRWRSPSPWLGREAPSHDLVGRWAVWW